MILGAVFLLSMMTYWQLKWVFLGVLAFGVILSFVQEKRPLPGITFILKRYDKKTDAIPGEGPLTFFLGAVITWFLFPQEIAIPAMIAMTFGDPMAYLFGNLIRGTKMPWNRRKTVTGFLSFLIVSGIIISIVYDPVIGITMALIAGIVESIDWKVKVICDDNVVVPVVSSFIFWIIFLVM